MNTPIHSSKQATACGALSIGVTWCEPTAVIAAGLTARASSRRGKLVRRIVAGLPGHPGGAANGTFAAAF